VIQRVIEDPLSEELLRLKHGPGDTVIVDLTEGEVKMNLMPKSREKRDRKERPEKAEAAAAGTPPAE
jgi:hypothetical protein